MLQLLQAYAGPGRTALSFAPTYSMYPEYARDTNTDWVVGHREERLLARPRPRRHADRGAPAGRRAAAEPEQPDRHRAARTTPIAGLCEAAGDGLLVVDEAYGEFRRAGTPSALELLPEHRNLVVTRTMSKAFALAGARLGYLAADPAICDGIRVVRLPYHLSAVTQAVALAALRHEKELLGRVDDLRAERDATVGLAARAADTRSRTATRISCCSASSGIVMLSGRGCWTGVSSCARSVRTGGSGCRSAPLTR